MGHGRTRSHRDGRRGAPRVARHRRRRRHLSRHAGRRSSHSIPVSYGYNAATTTFYFRLAAAPDSEKGDLEDPPATFVSYGRRDDRWWSVVARGRLGSTTGESAGTETLEGLEDVHIPPVDIFGARRRKYRSSSIASSRRS